VRIPALCAIAFASTLAQAAPLDMYRARTAGELAQVCGTPTSDANAATSLAFCHGVLAGAYGYFVATTPAEDRFLCLPNPGPTRTEIANGFVAWMKTRPNLSGDGAIDALFRYVADTYPCKR